MCHSHHRAVNIAKLDASQTHPQMLFNEELQHYVTHTHTPNVCITTWGYYSALSVFRVHGFTQTSYGHDPLTTTLRSKKGFNSCHCTTSTDNLCIQLCMCVRQSSSLHTQAYATRMDSLMTATEHIRQDKDPNIFISVGSIFYQWQKIISRLPPEGEKILFYIFLSQT